MSRIAEALRKSRDEITPAAALQAATARARPGPPFTTSDDPWEVADAVPRPEPVPEVPTTLLRDVVSAPATPALPLHGTPRPDSIPYDEITRLVQRIFHPHAGAKGVRAVLFSAIGEQTDAATLCSSAARALAGLTSESVCIVDSRVCTPARRIGGMPPATLGLSDEPEDADPTADDADSLVTRIDRNLWLPPTGSRSATASLNSMADQIRVRLPQLLATFEYVLIDAPAAGTHADVSLLGPLVDGVVLVVEADTTRRDAARRAAGQLQAANVRVLGVVLTNRTFPIPDAIYRRL
jgi:hypothetical protein